MDDRIEKDFFIFCTEIGNRFCSCSRHFFKIGESGSQCTMCHSFPVSASVTEQSVAQNDNCTRAIPEIDATRDHFLSRFLHWHIQPESSTVEFHDDYTYRVTYALLQFAYCTKEQDTSPSAICLFFSHCLFGQKGRRSNAHYFQNQRFHRKESKDTTKENNKQS